MTDSSGIPASAQPQLPLRPLGRNSPLQPQPKPLGHHASANATNTDLRPFEISPRKRLPPPSQGLSGMTGHSQHQPWLRQWSLLPEGTTPGSVHNKPLIFVPSVFPFQFGTWLGNCESSRTRRRHVRQDATEILIYISEKVGRMVPSDTSSSCTSSGSSTTSIEPSPSFSSLLTQHVAEGKPTLLESLANWAARSQTAHTHVNSLLNILKPLHPELPSDARTLLASASNSATFTAMDSALLNVPADASHHEACPDCCSHTLGQNTLVVADIQQLRLIRRGPPVSAGPTCPLPSPLELMSDFDTFEENLLIGDFRQEMMAFLQTLGGETARDFVRRQMRSLFVSTLLPGFNLNGRYSKRNFRHTNTFKMIQDKPRECPSRETSAVFRPDRQDMSQWLDDSEFIFGELDDQLTRLRRSTSHLNWLAAGVIMLEMVIVVLSVLHSGAQ
ncbi:hypothetical protein SprV_0702426800 [Sparganum proliferum]